MRKALGTSPLLTAFERTRRVRGRLGKRSCTRSLLAKSCGGLMAVRPPLPLSGETHGYLGC